ncbi:MAG: sulfotransferase domain-containing protein [bacterium]
MKPLYKRVARNLARPKQLVSWLMYQLSRGNNFFFVSMPCSGTHWLRFMLAKGLVERFGLEYDFTGIKARDLIPSFRMKSDRFLYNNRSDIPRIQHSHDFYSPIYWNRRVIFLIRDLRDSLASHYERYATWSDEDVSFADFLRQRNLDYYDVKSLQWRVEFLNSWGSSRDKLSDFLLVKYENLKEEPRNKLREIFNFLEFGTPAEKLIETVVKFGSRDNMRTLEREGEPDPEGTPKVHKAEVARHEPHFSESDYEYFREYIQTNLNYDFGYDYTC